MPSKLWIPEDDVDKEDAVAVTTESVVVVVGTAVGVEDELVVVVEDNSQFTFCSQSQAFIWSFHNVPDAHVYSYGVPCAHW